eukprot:5963867-Amphidinium_carterae.1
MPWDSPFMSLVRKGVPISALLPPWPDPRGSSAAPPCEVPPSEVVSPGETPAKRARVMAGVASSTMSRDGVLRFWADVCHNSPDTTVGAQVRGCGDEVTLRIVGDVMAVKATSTLVKRRSALQAFQKWGGKLTFPINELTLYEYVTDLDGRASPSTAQSFIEAV